MKFRFTIAISVATSIALNAQNTTIKNIDFKADSVLKLMTLDEKIGQLNQQNVDFVTGGGDNVFNEKTLKMIREGQIGSFLNAKGIEKKIMIQKIAMNESRMKIPMLFALDVIHGFRTVFPIPLAQSCSWDMAAIEKAERVAAIEASADGIHWTFAPMMDVGRDPRWGRVMEGAGEDTWLGSKIAVARVKGFQGEDLSKNNTILACAKHFAAYGAGESGREYNTVEMSERQLREFYLPPFKAVSDAGIGSVMNAFNALSGIPCSGHKHLVKDILKEEWGFKGFVVSDWASIGEMINHGYAKDSAHAAEIAMANQSSDMDMVSLVYLKFLKKLVSEGKVKETQIDDACRRILKMKFALGLFENPYKYFDKKRSTEMQMRPEHLEAARDLAKKSVVLLKNEGNILPLKKDYKKIAIIGPLADSHIDRDYMSFWTFSGRQQDVVTLYQGIKSKVNASTQIILDTVCVYQKSNKYSGDERIQRFEIVLDDAAIAKAVEKAKQAEVVILAVGENGERNGESRSRTELNLPGNQQKLVKAIVALGKPVVLVLFNGRPLTLEWESKNVPAIVEAWQPGTQAGNAVADVLFGDYNPSGKLTMSFPINVGQIPIYYNQLPTGRIPKYDQEMWKSTYSDVSNSPLYPFGFGLSYTTFSYSEITLNKSEITNSETLEVSVDVTNTGKISGEEVVQLYLRDLVADVSRPVKELRNFQKVNLKSGETQKVVFKLSVEDLKYWNNDLKYKADAGDFKVFVGPNSRDLKEKSFVLK